MCTLILDPRLGASRENRKRVVMVVVGGLVGHADEKMFDSILGRLTKCKQC